MSQQGQLVRLKANGAGRRAALGVPLPAVRPGEAREDRPRVVGDLAQLVVRGDVVVAGEERRDAGSLAGVGEIAPVAPGDSFLRDDQEVELHSLDATVQTGQLLTGLEGSQLTRGRCP